MNENAKKWVEALRSGRFQQGKYVLREDNKFCCLGVACELAIEDGISLTYKDGIGYLDTRYERAYQTVLPYTVQTWLKLNNNIGYWGSNISSLAEMNDSGISFSDIASYIENTPILFSEED